MTQKEKILSILRENDQMTQSELANAIYGDNQHSTNIYSALKLLVKDGKILRLKTNPAIYSMSEIETIQSVTPATVQAKYRDVSDDKISNETLEEASQLVNQSNNYGPENDLITRCLKRFPLNTDPDVVALKIGLIDITNSTHLSQHKSKISMDELCKIIAEIPDVDARIEAGDPEVVNVIARSNGQINLFSFATKYCCYHNCNLYEKDDYSILDTVLKEYLPKYFNDISKSQIQRWQDNFQYENYNNYITQKLNELGITVKYRKRKFDHFIWYKNR